MSLKNLLDQLTQLYKKNYLVLVLFTTIVLSVVKLDWFKLPNDNNANVTLQIIEDNR